MVSKPQIKRTYDIRDLRRAINLRAKMPKKAKKESPQTSPEQKPPHETSVEYDDEQEGDGEQY